MLGVNFHCYFLKVKDCLSSIKRLVYAIYFLFNAGNLLMTTLTERPLLTKNLSSEVFLDHYWLKIELATFCREQGISSQGAKVTLMERIAEYLSTGRINTYKPTKKPKAIMPDTFSPESIIEPGWRCTAHLRSFFQQHLGESFRFNAVMRHYILNSPGSRLGDAIEAYRNDQVNLTSREIAPQFEYNRFTRDFSKKYPNATREALLTAWREYRDTPKSLRKPI